MRINIEKASLSKTILFFGVIFFAFKNAQGVQYSHNQLHPQTEGESQNLAKNPDLLLAYNNRISENKIFSEPEILENSLDRRLRNRNDVFQDKIGPQPVVPTPIEEGTLFVSPSGDGDCTQANPCSLQAAKEKAGPGSVLFLAGGVYPVRESGLMLKKSGLPTLTLTYESLPGERAIFDGSSISGENSTVVTVSGRWNVLRNLTFRNFPENGIRITGNHNLLDGIITHNNKSSGIHVWGTYNFPYGAKGSWNTIQNSICYSNSDAGLYGGIYDDGGNADGISVSSGEGNMVLNNLVYSNSDDGIDVWRSTNSVVAKNVVHSNGDGGGGNGNGIKAGGASPGAGALIYKNISYNNRSNGFDHNSSPRVIFYNNTSFGNYRGFVVGEDNTVINNISFQDQKVIAGTAMNMTNNSWQLDIENPIFSSTDPKSLNFLELNPDSPALNIGKNVGLYYKGIAPDLGANEFKDKK